MNPPPRRVATPSAPPLSLKRKDREHLRPPPQIFTKSFKPPPPRIGSAYAAKSAFPLSHSGSARPARPYHGSAPASKPASISHASKPECNNLLLAGYMAHKFLTKGTIFTLKPDPARAAAMPPAPTTRSSRSNEPSRIADESYTEVASLLKTNGAHIPGIVNPTQLASFLNR